MASLLDLIILVQSYFKQVSHVVVDPLLYMYNLSFEMGIVPEKLKIGKIVPIFKGW